MTTENKSSAEQLAIALMAEARRLYGIVQGGNPGGVVGFEALADRLAGWATDVRQLGVDWFTTLQSYRVTAEETQERYLAAKAKLERIRALTETPSFLVHRDFILAVLDD